MIYGSVCSGIEAATAAWHPLGWRPAFFSEIEKFPSAVLAHHYPDVPNLGDMTKFEEWPDAKLNVLVGGTPCQSFSVAGLRKGLDDARGNLMLVYAAIARRYRPEWLVWENVPGVLSSGSGRDFGSLLGLLSGQRVGVPVNGWKSAGVVPSIASAYGLAWRVLDAQFVRVDGFGRAVPQRRRRVFVVGCLGSWQRAAAVLFERASLSGYPAPRRQSGQGSAPTLAARTKGGGGLGTDFDLDGGLIHFQGRGTNLEFGGDVAGTLGTSIDRASGSAPCVAHTLTRGAESKGKGGYAGRRQEDDVNIVAHALRADGFDASEDGTGRGTPLIAVAATLNAKGGVGRTDAESETFIPIQGVALRGREGGGTAELTGDVMTSLRTGGGGGDKPHVLLPDAYAINSHAGAADGDQTNRSHAAGGPVGLGIQEGCAYSLRAGRTQSVAHDSVQSWRVRRLMPVECERLQGFPDGYTAIPYPKPKWAEQFPDRVKYAADGPRYKACGNSMAVNCMRWIGRRIDMVNEIEGVI